MSLVNLAHVCSHLQNASLARLGLTSIPYTKLHLSLALLLQKQGFLSQVRLGGPSPPASVFGHGPRDNHFVTNHPHGAAERNQFSPEAALAAVVRKGYTAEQLAEAGYGREAIEFAQEHGRRTTEDLEKAGWPQEIARFVSDIRAQTDALAEEREGQYLKRREQHASRVGSRPSPPPAQEFDASAGRTAAERREKVEEEILATLPAQRREIYRLYKDVPRESLLRTKFDPDTLRYIAGRHGFLTERELKLHGITIEAMGLRISNQTITLPVDDYQDPAHMETEGVVTQENRASRRLWLGLKYYESLPVLSKAKMVSKPSKRIWLNSRELGRIVRGSQAGEVKALTRVGEIMAVRTVRGILEARECVERQVGGMPLCRVW